MEKRPDRPDREPDIVLPDTESYFEVEIWLDENLFAICGTMSDSISASTRNIENIKSAEQYINLLVENCYNEEDKVRVQPILDYLAEEAILGG